MNTAVTSISDIAACQSEKEICAHLKKFFANSGALERDENANSVFHLAANNDNVAFFRAIYKHFKDHERYISSVMLCANNSGLTPVHVAVFANAENVVRLWHSTSFPGFQNALGARESLAGWTPRQLAQLFGEERGTIHSLIRLPGTSIGSTTPLKAHQDALDKLLDDLCARRVTL